MLKKIACFFMISIFIFGTACDSCRTRDRFDQPGMDLSLDFALVDGNLVFCRKDGIYCIDVSHPDNPRCLVPFPESGVENYSAVGEPFVYMENNHGNVTVSYFIFHALLPTTMLLNRAIISEEPLLQAVVGDGAGCYREFEDTTVFASWPYAIFVASAVLVTDKHSGQQRRFHQPPYLFAYQPSGKSSRLFQYGDYLYCFVSKEKGSIQANLYQLDCLTGDFQPLIDTIVGDFVVEDKNLYYIAHGKLYHYNLDTQQCSELAACQILHCPEAVDAYLNHASCNHSVSIIVLEDNIFYVNPKQQLCLLAQSAPLYTDTLCFLQQQDQFIVAVLQNKRGAYRTVVLEQNGKEILALPMLAKVAVDRNCIIYTDGKHLYRRYH